jgi:hypothetical protein
LFHLSIFYSEVGFNEVKNKIHSKILQSSLPT